MSRRNRNRFPEKNAALAPIRTTPDASPSFTIVPGMRPANNVAQWASNMTQANGGFRRTAQMDGGGQNILSSAPGFYSPYHTPSAWQIPTNRKEVYAWDSYWYQNEPIVGSAIDFYSKFTMNGFTLDCDDSGIKEYFEGLVEKLELQKWLVRIAHEYFLYGDAFVFLELNCPRCRGTGYDQDTGDQCDHSVSEDGEYSGAIWNSISVFDPNTIQVQEDAIVSKDPEISMIPSERMIEICTKGEPKEIFDNIPSNVKDLIRSRRPIKLDNLSVTHLKFGGSPYQPYGTSLIRRLFPVLAYRDKLRQAQWIIAERHILPVKIVTIGSPERPATEQEISDAMEQLAVVANDPIQTIVAHDQFKMEWVGACYDNQTEVLTNRGFLSYTEVTEKDLIACYNPDTKKMEYSPYQEKHEYDYDSNEYGKLIEFSGKHYNSCVTRNHRMLSHKRKWDSEIGKYRTNKEFCRADQITDYDKFVACLDWDPSKTEYLPYREINILRDTSLEDFMSFIGYYLSEGTIKHNNDIPCTTTIYQNENSPYYPKIVSILERIFGEKLKISDDDRYSNNNKQIKIHNVELAIYLEKEFGHGCSEKKIPRWILGLSKEYLEYLLAALMDGDGDISYSESGLPKNRYSTTSKILADNIQEISLKMGYNPKMIAEERTEEHLEIHRIYWANQPTDGLRSVRSRNISEIDYQGKVWCFTVPTGAFITRRNGKIGIHGNSGKVLQLTNEFDQIMQELQVGLQLNSALLQGEGPAYNSAQVGLEALAAKLKPIRDEFKAWIEQKIFKPISKFNNFYQDDARGNTKSLIYPKVVWTDLPLKDRAQELNILLQLRARNEVSLETIHTKLSLDYGTEIEKLRMEDLGSAISSPDMGLGITEGEDLGGAVGGMGGGGAMPMEGSGLEGAEGAPPGGTEAPGAPGGTEGAAAPGPGLSAQTMMENYRRAMNDSRFIKTSMMENYQSHPILKKQPILGNSFRGELSDDPDIETNPMFMPWGRSTTYASIIESKGEKLRHMMRIAGKEADQVFTKKTYFTEPEQIMYKAVLSMNIGVPFYAQYIVGGNPNLRVDGAFPTIKIAIEADGETWHRNSDKQNKDKRRDISLQQQGWQVLRFTDKEIEEKTDQVIEVIRAAIDNRLSRR